MPLQILCFRKLAACWTTIAGNIASSVVYRMWCCKTDKPAEPGVMTLKIIKTYYEYIYFAGNFMYLD